MMLYLFCLLSLSMTVNESTLISQKVEFKDIDKAPDISSWIRPLRIVSVLEMCLLGCSKITECKYVLYDSPKCYLYNTSDGNALKINTLQPNSIVSCTASAAAKEHTCYNMFDGNLATFWMTDTNALNQWIRLEFAQYYEVHAVDLWSNIMTQGQCSRLTLSFRNNVIRVVDRECVTTNGLAYNRFEIGEVLSDYVNMTCIDRCLPKGWFVHYEMAVSVRL
ncbi:hypothetical protein LSH36_2102g00000 [Paralvinella palmiformis]|uniref:F5/8 type C domain-containing protein n=1 Tax=Paralvinella palmiformis TaxID=53620 RepID=A0AAD9MQB6_9ANNE|nr:hypothetical protein LSH36_2102g00000 [Paralvinella palmiformis]